ncbi:MAG: DUF503 domain-containing protein [Candidatus Aminicenantes bacterium]|nr:DUF503 domain-containing protein [Candidatus Aminicenantes bacterium]MDH5383591.1 DUF503 domain-containing protein [Candidatus Aminicenantes bacterium]
MIIGLLTLEIYLPYSHSLKEKRKTLNMIRDRLKRKYNIAFAELDYQNKWQRSKVGLVTLNTQKGMIEKAFQKIIEQVEENIEGEILHKEVFFL